VEDAFLPGFTAADRLGDAIDLDRSGNALDMRLARLLAVLKRMDLAPLGYGTFRAFCHAEVELRDRRIDQLVALAESPFARVRAAVVAGRLAPSVAARGIREIDPEGESAWLEDALAGRLSRPKPPPPRVEFSGAEVKIIHAARTLARLNLGQPVADAVADRHILDAWREQRSRQKLLDDARSAPPPPAPLPPADDGPDPADTLVGPWVEPTDPEHALALLRVVTLLRKERIRELAVTLEIIAAEQAYQAAGFSSFEAWVRRSLGVDVRTVQRYRKALDESPELDLPRALFLQDVATDDTRAEWAAIAPRVPVAELRRVRVLAQRGDEQVLRQEYTRVLARLDAALGLGATTGAKPRYVSLAATLPPPKAPRATEAHPDLPEAARWYLVQGRTALPGGLGRILLRDAHTCTNPECGARHLRVHVHHGIPRSQGGTDADENLYGLCPACHLRLRHSGHLDVTQRGEWLVFTFVDREIWMAGHVTSPKGGVTSLKSGPAAEG
jgi:hypothetical protein